MKVAHISTYYTKGGAAIACKRLVEAQRKVGIVAFILTQEEGNFPQFVISTTNSKLKRWINIMRLAWEKVIYLFYQNPNEDRFLYSIANTGEDIVQHPLIANADVIHLHWINGGFISLKGIDKIIKLGKPVVWTLHDIWPLTGGCHIVKHCENYKKECFKCFYLRNDNFKLSYRSQIQKRKIYNNNICFIAPSNWQKVRAEKSWIFEGNRIVNIPNPIEAENLNSFGKDVRKELNIPIKTKIVLFGAFNIEAEHKGMQYLLEALSNIEITTKVELIVFGKTSELLDQLPFKIHYLGYISNENEMLHYYRAADVFVTPSIEDNLPNTVLESMSVGTPVAAFQTGGIPDMIDHKKNGYLAEFKNSRDLARGIEWILNNNKDDQLALAAKEKVAQKFNPNKIASKFLHFYESLIKEKESV